MTLNGCKQALAVFVYGVLKMKNLLALIMNLCRLAPMTVCLNCDFYLLLKRKEKYHGVKKVSRNCKLYLV